MIFLIRSDVVYCEMCLKRQWYLRTIYLLSRCWVLGFWLKVHECKKLQLNIRLIYFLPGNFNSANLFEAKVIHHACAVPC